MIYKLTLDAEQDLSTIWQYSYEEWGEFQADKYFDQIVACCEGIGLGYVPLRIIKDMPHNIAFTDANIITSCILSGNHLSFLPFCMSA